MLVRTQPSAKLNSSETRPPQWRQLKLQRNNGNVGSTSLQHQTGLQQRIEFDDLHECFQPTDIIILAIWLSFTTKNSPVALQDGFRTLLPRPQGKGNAPGDSSADSADSVLQTLLARNYRGDIPMSAVEKFPILLSEAEEESSSVPPCFSDEGINVCFCHIEADVS